MKKISYYTFSVLIIFLCHSANAYERKDDARVAKDRQTSSYDAKGVRMGAFVFKPTMSVGNEYNTNIFKQDKQVDEVDSYIAHFKPGFTLASDWSRHLLSLSLDTDITEFSNQADANNYEDIRVDLTGRLDVLRDSYLDAGFQYNFLHEDRGSPDQLGGSEPTVYHQKLIDLAYYHKFNRFSIKPAVQFSHFDYKDTSTTAISGDLKQSTRSRWEYAPSLRVGYEIQPEYDAFAEFRWREVSYDTGVVSGSSTNAFQRNSSGYNALAGMEFDLTDLLTGDISVGYLYRDYVDARLPSISGVNGFVSLLWRPTALTSVTLAFSRDINETTQIGVSGVVMSSPSINIEHEVMRNVILAAGGKYSNNEYNGFDPANPTVENRIERKEDVYGGNGSVKYLLNRNFSLGLEYIYSSRDVNYTAANYEVHQVMFNINAQL